ncbi:MAG: cyclic pyranopterin monophosphate synthase [Phycisphaerae bacterium]|nr:MAG: cyclic pyranopterin monophosphate synthase [Phycisphaerae bacterium]
MPLDTSQYVSSADLLTPEEIERVVRSAADVGFEKIRLTGGEPTLRSDLLDIVERIARVDGIKDLSMTTNGVLLPRLAKPLASAGLNRVNIHIDSLDPQRFARLMRFGTFSEAWAGLEAAEDAGLTPIKINAVVVRDFNEQDVVELARLTIKKPWTIRFIELMPLGDNECARLAKDNFVPSADSMRRIEEAIGPLTPIDKKQLSDESVNYRLPDAEGIVGFISPVSDPYCGTCNRMRLTADGRFHLCLLNDDEMDVRAALRSGKGDAVVREILMNAVSSKPTGHRLHEGISTAQRSMFQIGG